MDKLLSEIRNCTLCESVLPHGCRPVLAGARSSKIVIIGQAPGSVVHKSGIPWNDKSGERLRSWLDISSEQFYDKSITALIPMGFCYPGTGKSGDLPPRKECAEAWHEKVMSKLINAEIIILIGTYAQKYYLKKQLKKNLTQTVREYHEYLPNYFVLPHPSPRNNIWLKKNPWFEENVIPALKQITGEILKKRQ